MDAEDIDRFGGQRAAEVAIPLINELAERMGINLYADDDLWLRMLSDLGTRLYVAGFQFGATETAATILEQLPPEMRVNITIADRGLPPRGPLGEDLDD